MSFSLWPWLAEASWKANRARFILYCRAGVFYCEDTVTRKQQSLKTKDREEAQALLHARNEALRQPALTWGNLSHFSNAKVPHSLAPEIHCRLIPSRAAIAWFCSPTSVDLRPRIA